MVRLGGASVLVNRELGEADNAVLLASLLVPAEGTTVQVLQPPLPGGGDAGLTDLIAPRVRLALWQLVVAFVLLALWRARRLGRPVAEPQPVQLPGAELVVAVGNLLQRAKGRGQAAGLLTDDLRRSLAERLGLPPSTPADQVADAVAARTGIPRERVLRTLDPVHTPRRGRARRPRQAIDTVRREVTRVRLGSCAPSPTIAASTRRAVSETTRSRGRRRRRGRRGRRCCGSATRSPRWSSARTARCRAWSPPCSSAATCCSRACPAWPRRCWSRPSPPPSTSTSSGSSSPPT